MAVRAKECGPAVVAFPTPPELLELKVGGYPAAIVVWAEEDWRRLPEAERPADARYSERARAYLAFRIA